MVLILFWEQKGLKWFEKLFLRNEWILLVENDKIVIAWLGLDLDV